MFGLDLTTSKKNTTFRAVEKGGEIFINGIVLCWNDVVTFRVPRNDGQGMKRVYGWVEAFDISPYYAEGRQGVRRLRVVRDDTGLVDYILPSEITDVIWNP